MKIEVELIEQLCSDEFCVKRELLHQKDRRDHTFVCRAVIWLLLRQKLALKDVHIAELYGFKRTNVLKAINSIQSRIETDKRVRDTYEVVTMELKKLTEQ